MARKNRRPMISNATEQELAEALAKKQKETDDAYAKAIERVGVKFDRDMKAQVAIVKIADAKENSKTDDEYIKAINAVDEEFGRRVAPRIVVVQRPPKKKPKAKR